MSDQFIGIKPVEERHRIDVAAPRAIPQASKIRPLGRAVQGRAVESDLPPDAATAGSYVLRRKPPGKLLPSAHAVDREFA